MKTYRRHSSFKIVRKFILAPLLTLLGIIPISGKKMQANCSINAFIHAILPSFIHKELIFSRGLALVMSLGVGMPRAMGGELEFVTEVPPVGNVKIRFINAMQVLDNNPNEIVFATENQGAFCGSGTPASAWKLILDPSTGDVIDLQLKQSLSLIQQVRRILLESSDGTLFTGGGWCGHTPPYYSIDGGETYQPATHGVHPPNSTYSLAEFNGEVYAGTGYEPYHGQVYRWRGPNSSDHWKLVLDLDPPRSIVRAMIEYENRLFVGSVVYWSNIEGCESTVPVYVSNDGNHFEPTTGISPCLSVYDLLVIDNRLIARLLNRSNNDSYMYNWNDSLEKWEEIVLSDLAISNVRLVSHKDTIYAYGKAPGDTSKGIYQSVDSGLTWKQVNAFENPDVSAMTLHNDILYLGTRADDNDRAYIYKLDLTDDDQLAKIAFDSATSSAEDEAEIAHPISIKLSLPDGGVLSDEISVDIIDSGTGTATSGVDYSEFLPQTITFPAGSVNGEIRTVELGILQDRLIEGDETVELELVNIQGPAVFGYTHHKVTITDEEQVVTLAFDSATSSTENETEIAHPIPIKLTVSGGGVLSAAISVDVMDTETGTATANVDYLGFATTTVTFPAGSRDGDTRVFELGILQDNIFEGDETVELKLVNPQGAFLDSPENHKLIITDDDSSEDNLVVAELKKITASGVAAGDNFGRAVSISGNHAIVGAHYNDDAGENSGSAFIFELDTDSGTWTQVAKIRASDAERGDGFGYSVSISDDYAIVGPRSNDDAGTASGSAYIFERDNRSGTWSEVAKITASDAAAYDHFGTFVSISGDQAIVGANGNDDAGEHSGSAYIFERDNSNGTWSQVTKIAASDTAAGDQFGWAVSISGDQAIVGARGSGSAYIFEWDSSKETWSEVAELTASDAAVGDGFGFSVSLSGDHAIVGASRNDDAGENSGSAYIFERDNSSGTWSQVAKLTASDAATNDWFGSAVSISSDHAIVGAQFNDDDGDYSGSAYIFRRDHSLGTWSQVVKVKASDAAAKSWFGKAVSISGENVIVGAPFPFVTTVPGSAYISKIDPLVILKFESAMNSTGNENEVAHPILVKLILRGRESLDNKVSVDVADSETGTATSGVDYLEFLTQTVTFPAGSVEGDTQTVGVGILQDTLFEEDETVELKLVNVQGGLLGSIVTHRIIITDDDQLVQLGFDSVMSSTEDEAEVAHPVSIKLTLPDGGVLSTPVSVDVVDSGSGTATSGVDYLEFLPQTITFPAGSLDGDTRAFELDILQDTLFEDDETVKIRLANPQGAFLVSPQNHAVTITDDDPIVTLAFESAESTTENEAEFSHPILIKLRLPDGGVLGAAVSVDVESAPGTATPDVDYVGFASTTVTFPAGSRDGDTRTFDLGILQDAEIEGDEIVELKLVNSQGALLDSPQNHEVTIKDDDQLAKLAFDAAMSSTSNEAEIAYPIMVKLTLLGRNGLDEAVSVDVVDTVTGTATSGVDYLEFLPQTITFPAGSLNADTQTVELSILQDAILEGDETVELMLVNLQGAAVLDSPQNHTITIIDDEPLVGLGFGSIVSNTGDESESSHTISVKLTVAEGAVVADPLSVDVIDHASGTATPGEDYSAFTRTTLTFPAGSEDGAVEEVRLTILEDEDMEDNETVRLGLTNIRGRSIFQGPSTHSVTIVDDDTPINAEGKLYWTKDGIHQANLGGSGARIVVPRGQPVNSSRIVVDGVNGKVYWTESFPRIIEGREFYKDLVIRRANLDGTGAEEFWNGFDLFVISRLSIDRASGTVFWAVDEGVDIFLTSIWGVTPSGSRVVSVDDTPSTPLLPIVNQVVADLPGEKVYWTDGANIMLGHPEREEIEPFITGLTNSQALALDVAGSKIYWSDIGTGKIQRANLDDGTGIEDVVAVTTSAFELDPEGDKIYWVGNGAIKRANLDGTEIETIVKPAGGDFSLDLVHDKLYWLSSNTIMVANLDGTDIERFEIQGANQPSNIVFDRARNKMYWDDAGTRKRSNLDGSDLELVLTPEGVPFVNGRMAVDGLNGKLVWAESGKFRRANPDGTEIEDLFAANGTLVEIDAERGKIYYRADNSLKRANFDGTEIEDLSPFPGFPGSPFALDVDEEQMFWAVIGNIFNSSLILRANLDGSEVVDLTAELGFVELINGFALDRESKKIYWLDVPFLDEIPNPESYAAIIKRVNYDGSQAGEVQLIWDLQLSLPQEIAILPALPSVEFSILSSNVDELAPVMTIQIRLNVPDGGVISDVMNVDIIDGRAGTAMAGVDYADFIKSTITFPAGSPDGTAQSFVLDIVNDGQIEMDETIQLRLANARGPAVIGENLSFTLTIVDDDRANFLGRDVQVAYRVLNPDLGEPEGYDPPRIVSVGPEVELMNYPREYPHLDVDLSATQIRISNDGAWFAQRGFNGLEIEDTIDGTVLDDVVGILLNGSETTAPGFSSDRLQFDDELDRIRINLQGLARTDFPDGSVIVVDVDFGDHPGPEVSFSEPTQSIAEGVGVIEIAVELDRISDEDVWVPFTVSGSATLTEDFDVSSSPLRIPAGTQLASIEIEVLDDNQPELDEMIDLTLGTPTNAKIGTVPDHRVVLEDNESSFSGEELSVTYRVLNPDLGEPEGYDPPRIVEVGPEIELQRYPRRYPHLDVDLTATQIRITNDGAWFARREFNGLEIEDTVDGAVLDDVVGILLNGSETTAPGFSSDRLEFDDALDRIRINLQGLARTDFAEGTVIVVDVIFGEGVPKVYFVDNGREHRILRSDVDGTNRETLVRGGGIRRDIVVDIRQSKMYWTEDLDNKILRANLDGSGIEEIITTTTMPLSLGLDSEQEKLYWIEGENLDKIQRANLDGTEVETLIDTGFQAPTRLALDLVRGKMYWTDSVTDKIQRANLDGTEVEDVVTTGLEFPRGIAVDEQNEKIYWTDRETDTIQRANLDGTDVEDLITVDLVNPEKILVNAKENKIYWSENRARRIRRANLDGTEIEEVVTLPREDFPEMGAFELVDLRPSVGFVSASSSVQNESRGNHEILLNLDIPTGGSLGQDVMVNVIDSGSGSATSGVDYTSFPATTVSFPAGSLDGETVTVHLEILDDTELEDNETVELRLDNPQGLITIGTKASHIVTIVDDDFNALPKVYFVDNGREHRILRSDVDGTNRETLVRGGGIRRDIVVDIRQSKMYWTEDLDNKILRANLDGSGIEEIITTTTMPLSLGLDSEQEKLYWIEGENLDKIQRANLDGTEVETLIDTGFQAPTRLALDLVRGKMYWTDSVTDKIQRANLDGTEVEDVVTTGLEFPRGIAVDEQNEKIYWTDRETDTIQRANLDGTDVEDLITVDLVNPEKILVNAKENKIYWSENRARRIRRANLDGTEIEEVVTLPREDFPEMGAFELVDLRPSVGFVSASSSVQNESRGNHEILLNLDIPTGGSLGQDVMVNVIDSGSGSATSGVDYTSFPATTVSFPAGSLDGETVTVHLEILDDTELEDNETVVLRLTNAHGPAVIGGNATHTVTIADDDEPAELGLIGHWKFDELNWTGVEGEVADSSGQGNHGTSGNGAQIFADGKINNAGEFDGVDDYVDLGEIERGHPLQLSSGGTLMGWFNQRPGHRLQRIFDKSTRGFGAKGYALLADPLKKTISIFVWGSHYQSEVGVYAFNEWAHVAAVIKESDFEIYVNGTKVNGAFVRGSAELPVNVKANMRIGSRNHKTGREFNGFLDDLRIYNRTLSEAEIKGIFDEASAGNVAVASQAGTEHMDIVKGKAVGSIINLFLSQTLYEDAEDGKIAGWSAYGDGSVVNVKEASGNRIISTRGRLDSDPFRLGRDDLSDWNNTKEFTASFAVLMEEAAAVYFRVDTTGGEKYLCYTPGPETIHVNHTLLHFGLGIAGDGEWHTIYRDLARDVANALPGTQLLAVKDFYVYGSVKLDNLMLMDVVY